MKLAVRSLLLIALGFTPATFALSLAPEEFAASRAMACVLARQSLGQLSEEEYGALTHTVLDGFDGSERDNILSKALGFYDGLMYSPNADSNDTLRLEDFLASDRCNSGYRNVTVNL